MPTRKPRRARLRVRVEALARRGGALATTEDGLKVYVRDGAPGDAGTVRVEHAGPNGVWAGWLDRTTDGPSRVAAECGLREACGGCPWMSATLTAQRQARWEAFVSALGDLPTADVRVAPWRPDGRRTGFRSRLMPMVGWGADGQPGLGLFAPRSRDVVLAERCAVEDPALGALLRRALARWHAALPSGALRDAGPRALRIVAPSEGNDAATRAGAPRAALLTVVLRERDDAVLRAASSLCGLRAAGRGAARPDDAELRDAELQDAEIVGVHAVINPREAGNLLIPPTTGGAVLHLAGAPATTLRWRFAAGEELTLRVGPTGFVQTRHDAAEVMLDTVAGWLDEGLAGPNPRARYGVLLDLHAGAGFFGLAMAGRADRVVLVERHAPSMDRARAAGGLVGLGAERLETIAASTADALTARPQLAAEADVVIVDPPRAGLDAITLGALQRLAPGAQLIYASCNPATLARDLRALTGAGLRLRDLAPIDMFPHSPHFELMARLTRPGTRR